MGLRDRLRAMIGLRSSEQALISQEQVAEFVENNVALASGLDPEAKALHLSRTEELVHNKRWEAADGFDLTPEMVVTVAANAAIAILGLDPWVYRMVQGVVLHPSATVARGPRSGPGAGTVSDAPVAVLGVATANSGPMTLSWDAVLADSRNPAAGRNVVLHEFAHKIDMSDGYTDGVPPLRGQELERWASVLAEEYEHTKTRRSDRVLDPYAWTNRAEFFAVATEAFFCRPRQLQGGKPKLYAALADYYRQDPATGMIWPPDS